MQEIIFLQINAKIFNAINAGAGLGLATPFIASLFYAGMKLPKNCLKTVCMHTIYILVAQHLYVVLVVLKCSSKVCHQLSCTTTASQTTVSTSEISDCIYCVLSARSEAQVIYHI